METLESQTNLLGSRAGALSCVGAVGRDDCIKHILHLLSPAVPSAPTLLQPLQLGVALFPGSALRSAALASRGDPSSAWLTPGSHLATAWKPCSLLACSSARPSASQDPQTTLKVREAAGLAGGTKPCWHLGPQGAGQCSQHSLRWALAVG